MCIREIISLYSHLLFIIINISFIVIFQYNPSMTILYDTTRKKEPPPPASQFSTERELCLKYFDQWSEQDQIQFVENLLSRMCHYQHGHINTYLKPMLQRDFISLLPSKLYFI